jgi:hypothetical protein
MNGLYLIRVIDGRTSSSRSVKASAAVVGEGEHAAGGRPGRGDAPRARRRAGPAKDVLTAPSHLCTQRLLSAAPVSDLEARRRRREAWRQLR